MQKQEKKWTDLQNRNIFLEKKHGYQGGTEGIVREFRMDMCKHVHMYTLLYLKKVTSKDLLYSTGNSVQYSVTT